MRKIRGKEGREARERFEGRRGRFRAGRRNRRRSDGRVPLAKTQKFSLSQFANGECLRRRLAHWILAKTNA